MPLILLGLSLNVWAIGRVFAADGRLNSRKAIVAVALVQLLLIGAGLWLVIRKRTLALSSGKRHIATAAAIAAVLSGAALNLRAFQVSRAEQRDVNKWKTMVASEERILSLTKELGGLKKSVLNLQLPDHHAAALFAAKLEVRDLAPDGSTATPRDLTQYGVQTRSWPLGETQPNMPKASLQLWRSALSRIDYFEHAKFYIVSGHFLDEAHKRYETKLGFSGLARATSGKPTSVHASQRVRWREQSPASDDQEARWVIDAWEQTGFEVIESDELLFSEVLDEAIDDAATLRKLRDSALRKRLRELYLQEDVREHPMKHPDKLVDIFGGTSPGLAVTDLDRDGHDDIYVVSANQSLFLHNNGDGTFRDTTQQLRLPTHDGTAALFGDFDNDGDADLFLGRDLKQTRYLVNEGGHFVDRTDTWIDGKLPMLVSALAAADYDNDGLLDLYISTYGAIRLSFERAFPKLRAENHLLGRYLPEGDAKKLHQLISSPEHNITIHAAGPPNMLLHNKGNGKFEIAQLPDALRIFRSTFHSSWADYDNDGDQDIYVANDFAPNNLLRNEGNGRFVDVSKETGTTDVGFGMGVAWGDYDQDGQQDLYVSNMYSKAGKRIIGQFDRVDERLYLMHRGNSLFKSNGKTFEKVSGTKAPAILVEKAGWSWGAQFVDFDNDGWLDIYALSGMITAPKKFQIPLDI